MILEFILLVFIIRYLQKSLHTASLLPQWNRLLRGVLYSAIVLLVVNMSVSVAQPFTIWLSHLLLLFLLYILYTQIEFRPARPLMLAVSPFILVSLLTDIVRLINAKWYYKWNGYFDAAISFSIIWLVAMMIINRKQQKALQKEKLKTKQEEEQNKIMAKLKEELEIKVAERTSELTLQKEELQHALHDLKSTQSQLIHAEKMASLGELTAGIAHEIQNPLNFVNNFSEVNSELIGEMKDELLKGNIDGAKAIADDINENEKKIIFHGKRADAIVKGMLQHSRSSSGVKETTDINDLADEYLRLAYHGLRAKDKSFNATMKTDFDGSIGNININPQDIGRVILNLITNAFYAASLPSSQNPADKAGFSDSDKNESPTIWVSTKKEGNNVLISVKDNGPGIPQNVLDKIFQPFFTTKPTGQGTGLGLSLSYDIVKAHGGEITVETKEGVGSEFIIQLPTL
ncbi:MAG: ATP-binding protein [Flavisolibacter sp.]